MIEAGAWCPDVVTQVASATRALQEIAIGLLNDHLRHCVTAAAAGSPTALRVSPGGAWKTPRPIEGISTPLFRAMLGTSCAMVLLLRMVAVADGELVPRRGLAHPRRLRHPEWVSRRHGLVRMKGLDRRLQIPPASALPHSWSMTCSSGCLPPTGLRRQFGRAVAVIVRVQRYAWRYELIDAIQDLGVQRDVHRWEL
jgi:hypothetical protein